MNPDIIWQISPTLPDLSENDVHVWRAWLNPPPERVLDLAETLSADEAERARRFVFDHDRERFIVGRGFLRAILGHYLNTEPAQIKFKYGSQGKPALETDFNGGLHFNLSHSGNLVLYAIARRRDIGIDVEAIRSLEDMAQIAKRFFSPAEYATLCALPVEEQPTGFFNCWTRKEAYIKAIGSGLTQPLDEFDVTLAPGRPARLLRVQNDPQAPDRWSLIELKPAPDYAAALITAGRPKRLFCRQWPG